MRLVMIVPLPDDLCAARVAQTKPVISAFLL